jgi:hypothetical protein
MTMEGIILGSEFVSVLRLGCLQEFTSFSVIHLVKRVYRISTNMLLYILLLLLLLFLLLLLCYFVMRVAQLYNYFYL